jgi:hypothetical protein
LIVTLSVRWLTTTSVALEWVTDGVIPADSYYMVQKSEFSTEKFQDILTPISPTGVLSGIDTLGTLNEVVTFYYKVQVRSLADDTLLGESTVEHARRERPKVALEIVRRNNLLLRRFVGLRGFLLTKKETGARCTTCWDSVKERRNRSKCSECGSTGFFSGLSVPTPIFIASSSSNESQTVSILGAEEEVSRSLWTSNYPIIHAGDIIILDNKEVYRVEGIRPVTFRETIVSQTLQVTSLSKSREYSSIPLPSFEEFSALDLIHRQYGGVSTAEHNSYKGIEPTAGSFSIHKEGDKE